MDSEEIGNASQFTVELRTDKYGNDDLRFFDPLLRW